MCVHQPMGANRIPCFSASPQPDPGQQAQGHRPHRRAAQDQGGIKPTELPATLFGSICGSCNLIAAFHLPLCF